MKPKLFLKNAKGAKSWACVDRAEERSPGTSHVRGRTVARGRDRHGLEVRRHGQADRQRAQERGECGREGGLEISSSRRPSERRRSKAGAPRSRRLSCEPDAWSISAASGAGRVVAEPSGHRLVDACRLDAQRRQGACMGGHAVGAPVGARDGQRITSLRARVRAPGAMRNAPTMAASASIARGSRLCARRIAGTKPRCCRKAW